MLSCLQNAYDLHVHSGPDIVNRKADDPEMCRRYIAAGFKGYCIKSHYFCTAERARLMNQLFPELNVIGAISLNRTVGGLNPEAVDAAGRDGAKLVWMPTFDAKNGIDFTFSDECTYDTMPAWAKRMWERRKQGICFEGLTVLENEEISAAVRETLDVIARYNMVLCTGHLSKKEIFPLVKAALDQGVKKIIVTHATWSSVALTKQEQLALAKQGAYIEQCSANMKSAYGITWEGMYEVIRYVGAKHCIISSDCGNVNKPYPDSSILEMAEKLLQHGFCEEDVCTMAVHNPTYLVEE